MDESQPEPKPNAAPADLYRLMIEKPDQVRTLLDNEIRACAVSERQALDPRFALGVARQLLVGLAYEARRASRGA